jgi:uncharacterized protein (TIGR02246 family)
MTSTDMIALVERYFAAVDAEDLPGVLATLTPDCVFTVETHGVRLQGHDQISGMFHRLWSDHAAVKHLDFTHVAAPDTGRIASRFRVENTETDRTLTHKSNCNFFSLDGDRFNAVAVYMAGANTLKGATRG